MKLLLDEHIALAVAEDVAASGVEAAALRDWHSGAYFQMPDDVILQAAHADSRTLVTYDLRTIPPFLKVWGEQGTPHGGAVFVDERTVAPSDVGGLACALRRLIAHLRDAQRENRVVYLPR